MKQKIEELLKVKPWEWIPVIGTMAYAIRVDFFLNNQEKAIRKAVKKYLGIYRLIGFIIAIGFLVTFFLMRNHNGNGAYPWPFWVGMAIGLSSNLTVLIPKGFYILGFNKWKSSK